MSSHLSSRDHAVIEAVTMLRQVTSHQIERLCFSEPDTSPLSRGQRTRRRLAALTSAGYLTRIPLAGEWGGFVYQPGGARTRTLDPHGLDVAELYVRLAEAEARGECKVLEFTPEDQHGRVKADAYVWLEVNGQRADYYVEIDRASEFKPQLRAKLRSYSKAYRAATDNFPLVMWVVSFAPRNRLDERVSLLKGLVRAEPEPALFDVLRLDETIKRLCK